MKYILTNIHSIYSYLNCSFGYGSMNTSCSTNILGFFEVLVVSLMNLLYIEPSKIQILCLTLNLLSEPQTLTPCKCFESCRDGGAVFSMSTKTPTAMSCDCLPKLQHASTMAPAKKARHINKLTSRLKNYLRIR